MDREKKYGKTCDVSRFVYSITSVAAVKGCSEIKQAQKFQKRFVAFAKVKIKGAFSCILKNNKGEVRGDLHLFTTGNITCFKQAVGTAFRIMR